PYALSVEGALELGGLDRALALVEHLDIAAEWDRGNYPLGAVGTEPPGGERPAKTHGKPQDLDAPQPGDDVMPVLVHHDQHAERDDEGDDGLQQAHATALLGTRASAARRASASAAITASRLAASHAGTASSASAMTRAMPV